MLKPDKNDPNYEDQIRQYQKDSSSWGEDATKVDIMKRPGATPPAPASEPAKK